MTRQQVEKAFARMDKFYNDHPDLINPMGLMGETYEEACIRAFSEFEYDDFDYETQKWFEEDETIFAEKIKRAEREMEVRRKFIEKVMNYYDKLEQEEESK